MQCPLSRAEGRGSGHKSMPRRAWRAGLPWSARDVCVSVVMSRHICTADLAVLAGSCPRARRRLTVLGSRFRGSRCVARVRWSAARARAGCSRRRRVDVHLAVHYLISVNVIRRRNSAKRGTETVRPARKSRGPREPRPRVPARSRRVCGRAPPLWLRLRYRNATGYDDGGF